MSDPLFYHLCLRVVVRRVRPLKHLQHRMSKITSNIVAMT